MTSQVAVFNPLGVAVASDTVSTLIGKRGTKTLQNAEKIWCLDDIHRVVVALSGSFNINGTPARLLISSWNKSLEKPFETLHEYAENFYEWLSNEEILIPVSSNDQVVEFILNDHYMDIRNELQNAKRRMELDEIQASDFFRNYVASSLAYLNSLEPYYEGSDIDDSLFVQSLGSKIESTIVDLLGEFPGFLSLKDDLLKQAPLVLSRKQHMDSDTHLTFVGFGESEFFAHSIETTVRGRYGKKFRGFINEPFPPRQHYTEGVITALAQRDAIIGFVYGVEDRVLQQIHNHVYNYILQKYDNKEEGEKEADEFLDFLSEEIQKFSQNAYLVPLLNSVGVLNLNDAAELAESLVGVQAMRAKASPRPAGVGGFIESLVIDKFEGVRWIKRLPR